MNKDLAAGGLLGLLAGSSVVLILLLIVGIVLIAVLIGVGIIIYVTLVSYHLMTAVAFGLVTLIMFVASAKTGVFNEQFMKQYPWIWLILPFSFILGYVIENAKLVQYTVAPYAVASPLQVVPTSIVMVLLFGGVLFLLASALD